MTDSYRLLTGEASDEEFSDRARVASAREFILGRREPWMLHLHMLDTHWDDFGSTTARSLPTDGKQGMPDRTDDALRQVDGYIAQLHQLLESTGQIGRTMIIVYADHSIGWTTNERVPLLVALPGQRAPNRVGANVQLLDIAPTVLNYLRMAQPDWMVGRSLLDPSALNQDRPIYGLWRAWSVNDPDVPRRLLNEAKTASVVVCNQWTEMSLTDGRVLGQGLVEGHTRPCSRSELAANPASAQLLAMHLRANGYAVSEPLLPRSRMAHRQTLRP